MFFTASFFGLLNNTSKRIGTTINDSVGLMVTTVLDFQNKMRGLDKIQMLYDYIKDAVCNDLLKGSKLDINNSFKMRVYCK
jgi:hypothetical protein